MDPKPTTLKSHLEDSTSTILYKIFVEKESKLKNIAVVTFGCVQPTQYIPTH